MKPCFVWLFVILMLATPYAALAESTNFTLLLDDAFEAIMLMDQDGNSLSTVNLKSAADGQIYWTLRVTDNGAETAYLFTKDENGNWIKTPYSFPMNMIFGRENGHTVTEPPAPTLPFEPEKPWPVYAQIDRYSVTIRPLDGESRAQSRTGPDRSYHGAGGYKPYKVTSAKALFTEGSYILVELDYTTVGTRIIYFQTSAFSGTGNVPAVTLEAYDARTVTSLIPVFGPGRDYDEFTEAAISSGIKIHVFFEENGWVFAEFPCELGYVRAWIPVDQITW